MEKKIYTGDFKVGQKVKYLGLNNPIVFISNILYNKDENNFYFYFVDEKRKQITLVSLEKDIEEIPTNQLSLF